MKNKLKEAVKDMPFFLLGLNGICILILSFAEPIDYTAPIDVQNAQYVKHMNDYDWMYSLVYEFSAFSIPTVLFMAFYAYLHRYCLYSWVCIIGLGLLNVLNIAYFFFNFNYHTIYAMGIIIPCLTLAAIKWRQSYFRPKQV